MDDGFRYSITGSCVEIISCLYSTKLYLIVMILNVYRPKLIINKWAFNLLVLVLNNNFLQMQILLAKLNFVY